MPKAGISLDIKPQKPTDKLKATLAKLNELPQEAAREAKTMEDLKKENLRLKTEISSIQKKTKSPDSSLSKQVENKIQLRDQVIEGLKGNIADLLRQMKARDGEVGQYKKAILVYEKRSTGYRDQLINIAEKLTNSHGIKIINDETKSSVIVQNNLKNEQFEPKTVQKSSVKVQNISSGDGSLGKCSREIIKFLAQYSEKEFTKAQVAIATGYSVGSGGFNNSLSELNQKGFVIRSTGKLQVNVDVMPAIIETIGEISHQEYNTETFKENLGKCERQIYEELLNSPQYWFSKQELAENTGYSADSGGFNNSISRLNTLELINRKPGAIQLNPELLDLIVV